jgi:hypothetical protein
MLENLAIVCLGLLGMFLTWLLMYAVNHNWKGW